MAKAGDLAGAAVAATAVAVGRDCALRCEDRDDRERDGDLLDTSEHHCKLVAVVLLTVAAGVERVVELLVIGW